jgi:hypothetical protein
MRFLKRFGAEIARLITVVIVLSAVGASGQMYKWSQTAGTNANADPHINWAEGQAPSSINDSARAMMAGLAQYRDDISGLVTTGGSSTAYTATTNQGLAATPNDGQILAITVNATNGVAPTLAADGGTAFPIQTSPAVAVPAATLISGSPYTLKFSVSNSAWMLRNFYGSAFTIPLGVMMPFTGTTSPNSNFVFPAGQCLSTTTYASYWVLLGSPASGTCSGGQFRIIDMSGRVPAGLDTMPGFSAANRLTSSATGCGTAMTSVGAVCANASESSTIATANLPPYTPSGTMSALSTVGNVLQGTPITIFPSGGGGAVGAVNSVTLTSGTLTSNGTLVGSAQGGSSTAIPRIMPVVGVTYLLRVI